MSEYLDEEEQIARMKSWWDENGTSVIGSVVIAVVAIIGWNWYQGHSQDQVYAAADAYENYTSVAPDQREVPLRELAENHGGTAYHVFALMDQAKTAIEAGDFSAALGHYEQVVAEATDPLLADLGRIHLARVQAQLDLTSDALSTLAAIKNAGYRSWVLEIQGDIHAAAGEIEQAHQAYTAASESLREGESRPLLQMKLDNAAPFEEQFVPLAAPLTEALEAAQAALEEAEADAAAEAVISEETLSSGESAASDSTSGEASTDEDAVANDDP